MSDITRILIQIERGDAKATSELFSLVYDELRRIATLKLANEQPGQMLQATALVHEAYVRLVESAGGSKWQGRSHFLAAAAEAMRRILVDAARKKQREKHGGGRLHLPLMDVAAPSGPSRVDVLTLDEALIKLADEDPKKADLVTLRFFGGLSIDEAAEQLGISRATASRHWTYAKAWLYDKIFFGDSHF